MPEACVWCGDLDRLAAQLQALRDAGLVDDHPSVVRVKRRIRGAKLFDDREHGRTGTTPERPGKDVGGAGD